MGEDGYCTENKKGAYAVNTEITISTKFACPNITISLPKPLNALHSINKKVIQ